MLVTFSGLDGAGKTTQINLFTEYLKKNNYVFKRLRMYEDISSSALMGGIFSKKNKSVISRKNNESPYRYDKNRKGPKVVFWRKIAYIFDLFLFLTKNLYYQKVKKNILIMDRYIYDSLANLFHTDSRMYIKCMLKIIPKPDLAILLDTEPQVAFQRKPEYPPKFYGERREAYLSIFESIPGSYIINSNGLASTQNQIHKIFIDSMAGLRIRSDKYSLYVDLITKSLFHGLHKADMPKGFKFDDLVMVLRKNRIINRWAQTVYPELNEQIKSKIMPIADKEKVRLKKAIEGIGKVTEEFNKRNLRVLVIKTFDNYPDLGHDIDLYTDASIADIDDIFINTFKAKLQLPTFADRLSQKRNYTVKQYGTFEMHCSKLGELGEDNLLAQDLILNRVEIEIGGISTYVAKPEYRLLLCVLQRIYRHFNIRICDTYNSINMLGNNQINWEYLQEISHKYGIWEGVLLYLNYIQKIAHYYDIGLNIEQYLENKEWPDSIRDRNMHFRFPLVSTGISTYSRKIAHDLSRLNLYSLLRISLVLPLSLIHYVSVKLFGHSKVW